MAHCNCLQKHVCCNITTLPAISQVRDALRGKAGDEKAVQELAEHKEVIKAAQLKAEEVGGGLGRKYSL